MNFNKGTLLSRTLVYFFFIVYTRRVFVRNVPSEALLINISSFLNFICNVKKKNNIPKLLSFLNNILKDNPLQILKCALINFSLEYTILPRTYLIFYYQTTLIYCFLFSGNDKQTQIKPQRKMSINPTKKKTKMIYLKIPYLVLSHCVFPK